METDGRDTDQNPGHDANNVVRLPRDWLGPREELIPFGPAAWRADSTTRSESQPPAGPGADVLELTPRPAASGYTQHDFWGGELEAIPRPVIGPRPAPEPRDAREDPAPRAAPQARRARVWSAGVRRALARVAEVPLAVAEPVRITRARTGVVVSLVVLTSVGGMVLESSPHGRPAPPRAWLGAVVVPDVASALAGHLPKDGHPLKVITHHTKRPLEVTTRHAGHRARRVVHHPAAVSTPAPTFVRTSTQTPSTSDSATPVVSHTTTTSPRTTAPTRATTASSHTTKSGPVGRGAPFGPGQLG